MRFITLAFFFFPFFIYAQLDLPAGTPSFNSTGKGGREARTLDLSEDNSSLNFSNTKSPKTSNLGKEDDSNFSMVENEYKEYKSNLVPKYFSQDKEIKAEYGKDMYLGDLKTNAKSVSILYRDHEYVDGDRIRVFVNDEMIVANVMLEAQFRGFDLPLQDGFNKIDFQALNQGTSGPNTAQLQIRDEVGNILANYEWNLLTGNKATAIIVKQ